MPGITRWLRLLRFASRRFRPREPPRRQLLFAEPARFARRLTLPRMAQQVLAQFLQLLLSIEGLIGGLRLARLNGASGNIRHSVAL
ncbi:hypothetical protein [Burkholderia sp. 8Y]|uniref:hypothetical protein n=1 Tax=Burkholderia sp. 8Y TaxID=2653133 RepID=UPI001359131A|nr:hypothetical protein [Burkholderia sp. 8Y]